MNKINYLYSHVLLAVLFVALGVACTKVDQAAEAAAEKVEEAADQAEKVVTDLVETASVLNPNRATEEELLSLPHMTAEVAKGMVAARPFLTATALNEHLAQSLSAEQVSEVFVSCFVPINLNTASEEEIKLVPGVGNKMAHEFEEYRPYAKIEQFRREMGKYVDEAEVARMEQYVFVPIELNTATEEEIKAIPGVGNKMAHEFEEYRPYENMDQFRREIGKYVDENEVERLARYVYIK